MIYDYFYIPCNGKERSEFSYETFLSCALSFESEYSRIYPSKKEENEKFAYVKEICQESADKLDTLFSLATENKISRDDFEKCFYGDINSKLKKFLEGMSKTKAKQYQSYYNKII